MEYFLSTSSMSETSLTSDMSTMLLVLVPTAAGLGNRVAAAAAEAGTPGNPGWEMGVWGVSTVNWGSKEVGGPVRRSLILFWCSSIASDIWSRLELNNNTDGFPLSGEFFI